VTLPTDSCRQCIRASDGVGIVWRCRACVAKRYPSPIARTDAEVLDAVETRLGMGAGAWDCVEPLKIVRAFREVLS
jgi:hypothetical protein